jgi:hypothetical protein
MRKAERRACSCGKRHHRYGRCRVSRPLCHVMRLRVRGYFCSCDGYHYRHRKGGGLCVHAKGGQSRRNLLLYGVAL